MSQPHSHNFGDKHGSHGIEPPPPAAVLEQYRQATITDEGSTGTPIPLHFFKGPGPLDVRSVRKKRVRTRDGTYKTCNREFLWYLDKVEGTTRTKALDRLYDVLLASNGFIQTGVHWKRVFSRAEANILVRVIPMATTVCGPGAAGCYSWGYEYDGKPVAEMGVEYIDNEGPWAALVNMELSGHGTFRADDMYFDVHMPYATGVMGTWEAMARAGYMPTQQEVADAVTWLEGKTPAELIHWH